MRSHSTRPDGEPEHAARAVVRMAARAGAVVGLMGALLLPAQAQFWGDWGGQRQQPRYQQQQQYNPFADWFRNTVRPPPPRREAPVDNSHAPTTRKADAKDESKVTTKIVVMGDGMADWLAYGLEDAFSEQPEVGIVRKHRTSSGLIHYEPRKDTAWSQVAKDIITAEKPKFIVMMVGVNDRQSIHEQAPAARSTSKRGAAHETSESAPASSPDSLDPEALARQSADAQNAAIEAKAEEAADAAAAKDKRDRQHKTQPANGTFEFHSEQWETAYIKRIDATIAALKGAGVPVFWVGLPAQRNSRVSSDAAYLNDLYRQRADKAGIVYVDIWDGFVDEGGRYTTQGPDYEGQTRRLRSGDGVYFTKAGARKLAHYVEREIQRSLTSRAVPVALPVEPAIPAPGSRPGSSRPVAGPVVPLTVSTGGGNELLGGSRAPRRPASDPVATRVLTKGEPLAGEAGRADDFSWPRGSNSATANTTQPAKSAATPDSAAEAAPVRAKSGSQARRPATSTGQGTKVEAQNDERPPPPPVRKKARRPASGPRPPMSIGPSSWFR